MKVLVLLLAGLGLVAPVQADSAAPGDFAYGLELSAPKSVPVLGLTLPEKVLRTLTDRELGDLCIFDAQGVQRPHALHVPRDAGSARIDVPAAHFPLEASDPRATDGVEVRVERDPLGQIARAFSKPMVAEDARLVGYLVDAHELADPVVAVALTIAATRDYTVEVRVEASDDLTVFRPLTTATLAHLENEGRSLDHDLVELPDEVHTRYLRLSFARPPSADLRIESVRLRVARPVAATPRRFVELPQRKVDPAESPTRQDPTRPGQSFSYAIAGMFRFDRYSVVLPAGTPLIEGSLLSAPSAQGPFRELDRALFRQPPSERELMPTEHGYFELRVSDKGGGVRDGVPQLRMGYLAPQVLFASNDSSSYLLAYGSASARCRSFDEDELSTALPDRPAAEMLPDGVRVLREKKLAGPTALVKPEPPRPVRVYFLWAVLVIAVAVLAAVARKLLRAV